MKIEGFELAERMKFYKVPGISITIIDQGQISEGVNEGSLEKGCEKNVKEDTLFNACSISKFLTGMLVMKLTELGKLNLDEDINKKLVSWHLPENKFTKLKAVTLRNLLCHQSGIKDTVNSFTELNSNYSAPSMIKLLEGESHYNAYPINVTYEPGSEFHYSDAGYCIIQQIIEDVLKEPFPQVMDKFIFRPLNMENSKYVSSSSSICKENFSCGHSKHGDVVEGKYTIYPYSAASGLWSTSKDIAKLVQELMNALKGESITGISSMVAKELITPQGGKEWSGLSVFLDKVGNELEITSLGWGVGYQSMMVAFPYLNKGAVIMTNADLGVHQLDGIIGEIYQAWINS